jgi:hypothetical protein
MTLAFALAFGPSTTWAQDRGKRPVPDYDGRGEEPADAADIAIWIPRLALSPLYLVTEYLIRRPLGFVVTEAERSHLPSLLVDFLTFGEERKSGIVPTALFDFGFRPSVGLYVFGDDFMADGNDLRIHTAYGGRDWLSLSIANRTEIRQGHSWLSLELSGIQRPDYIFYGMGPDSDPDLLSRYQTVRLHSGLLFESRFWRASELRISAGVENVHFVRGTCCGAPSMATRVLQGELSAPPGFEEDYTRYGTRFELAIDSRTARPSPGDGIRVDVEAEHAFDLRDPIAKRWLKYGGTLGLYWDPGGHNRMIDVSVTALFADPIGPAPVPFTEQVALGGLEYLRGFREGRLVDRSAVIAMLEYRWPVWIWLDGTVHVSVGNVFGEHLRDFDPRKLRISSGVGFRAVGSRDHSFDLLLGLGSEPIDNLSISSVRILIGATRGF